MGKMGLKNVNKKYLMVDDYMLDKVLDKTKEIIGIKKCDDTKILTDADDKLPDDVTLKKHCDINDMTINYICKYF